MNSRDKKGISEQVLRQTGQRNINAQNGYRLTILVTYRNHISYCRRLILVIAKEGFRPIAAICLQGFCKPFGMQIRIIITTQCLDNDCTITACGIGTEGTALLGIVVLLETDAATADFRI